MINWVHVHLMINHVPVIGIFGAVLLLVYSLNTEIRERVVSP